MNRQRNITLPGRYFARQLWPLWLGIGLAVLILPACGYPADWDDARKICQKFQDRAGSRTAFYEYNRAIDDSTTPEFTIQSWPRTLPIQRADLLKLERELSQIPTIGSIIFSYGDQVLYEKYFNGVRPTLSQNVHSLSKSVLAMVVGIMLKKQQLSSVDTKLSDVLPDDYKALLSGDKQKLTVADMMSMSSGLQWEEDVTEYELEGKGRDWIAEILNLPIKDYDTKKFNYSTGNSHVLSAMVKHLTGDNLCEYTHRHLFLPLGIEADHWGVDPRSYSSGGFEVNLTAREIALLGHMLVNDDAEKGYLRFFTKAWLEQSTSLKSRYNASRGYAYLWWVPLNTNNKDLFFAWGFGGQFLFVMPSQRISLVITTNTSKDQNYEDAVLKAVLVAFQ